MDLSLLAGNDALKRQLEANDARRGLSHAYILAGPPGSGRKTLSRLLCAALICSGGEGKRPCGACPGCKKVFAGIHPDFIRVGDDGKDVTVAQVRALRTDAYIRPNEAERKVYLIENAQTMNQSAQNAMLKLLEDGPAYAAFLLVTDNAFALLETVRSRCETLSLSPVTRAEAEEFLLRRFPDKPREAVLAAAARCEGLIGRAVAELGEAEADGQARQGALELMRRITRRDELAMMEYAVSLEKWDRAALAALLGEEITLLRDALVTGAGGESGEADPERREAALACAKALSPAALLGAVGTLERLRTACAFNAGTGHLAGWLCAALSAAQ